MLRLLAAIICLAPSLAFAQPAESLPPTQGSQANVDKANADGSTGSRKLTAADYQAFIDLWASGSAWEDWNENVTRRRPGNAINPQATVTGTSVALTWTAPAPAMVTGTITQYVTRDGTLIAQLSGTANNHTDSSVPNGSHQWTISTRNVTTGSYAGTFAPVAAAPSVSATVGTGPPPSSGWTDLSLPAGALSFYVSASGGSDSNAGTQAAPLKTIAAGYARLRDGQPDQLLLRCGDTFTFTSTFNLTKGSGSSTRWMVIGSYGTGARPKLTGTSFFNGEALNKKGIAFVGLEFAGNRAPGAWGARLLGWQDVLIEDCCFHDIFRALIYQGWNGVRGNNLKFRRNVCYDITADTCDPAGSTNCCQTAYTDLHDNWLFEENYFDRSGLDGTMYARTLYVQDNCGYGIFRNNVSMRGLGDGGVQLRSGGSATGNLFLRSAINLYVGHTGLGTNEIAWNCFIESGNMAANHSLDRGRGVYANGPVNIHHNVASRNTGTGWGYCGAIVADGSGTIANNVVEDWSRDPALGGQGDVEQSWGIKLDGNGAFTLTNNRVTQRRPGIIMERSASGPETSNGNVFSYIANRYPAFGFVGGNTRAGWTAQAAPADPQLANRLPGGSIDAYAALCRGQSKQTWRDDLMPQNVNPILRAAVGIAEPINP